MIDGSRGLEPRARRTLARPAALACPAALPASLAGLLALACVATLSACPAADDPPASSTAPPGEVAPEAFRTKAHADGFARMLPLARAALDRADPLTASFLDGGPLRARPFATQTRAPIGDAVEAAWKEAAALRGDLLSIEQATLLEAARFGLSRVRDEMFRLPTTRLDPAVGVGATVALVDEIVARGRGCDGCDAALADGATQLDAALADLGATNPLVARATADDCAVLRERVARVAAGDASITQGAAALGAALQRCTDGLAAIATALDRASPTTGDRALESIAPAPAPDGVVRVPDRLGARLLRRWLEVHEHEVREPRQIIAPLLVAARQLRGLAGNPEGSPAEQPAVDTARCVERWAAIEVFASTQPSLVRAFDCTTDLWRLPATGDDDDLTIALVDVGIVEPTRRTNRKRTEPTLARVGGDVAPATHRQMLTLAVLSGAKQSRARARVAAAAQRSACTAVVALSTHGEVGDPTRPVDPSQVGDPAKLAALVGEACSGVDLERARNDALARPTAALAGIGLELLAAGPADAIALERGWWLPIGLVLDVARPEAPPPDVDVRLKAEPIVPSTASEANTAGETNTASDASKASPP